MTFAIDRGVKVIPVQSFSKSVELNLRARRVAELKEEIKEREIRLKELEEELLLAEALLLRESGFPLGFRFASDYDSVIALDSEPLAKFRAARLDRHDAKIANDVMNARDVTNVHGVTKEIPTE